MTRLGLHRRTDFVLPRNVRDIDVGCVCCGTPVRAVIGFGEGVGSDGVKRVWERVVGWRVAGAVPFPENWRSHKQIDPCPECGAPINE